MAQYNPLLRGAIELHCHSSPSIFARRQTDWELVDDIRAAGMAGALLKSHESQSADRATLIRAKISDTHIYGGLACNYPTGGLSVEAVDTAIRLGAKCIWMPTISSTAHLKHFAHKKTSLFQSEKPIMTPKRGLSIFDEHGIITTEIREILQLIKDADIILATGHLPPVEVMAIVELAASMDIKKILIQHADMGIARIPMDMQRKLVESGAIIEKCYLATTKDCDDITIDEMVETMKQLGYEHCVMVTDFGQAHNIPVVQALSDFVDEVQKRGVPDAAIQQMIIENPRKLLNI